MQFLRSFLAWMTRPQISLFDRIAIFIAFTFLGLCSIAALSPVYEGVGIIRRVQSHGIDTIARVAPHPDVSRWQRIEYDGQTAMLRNEMALGSRPPVTYLAANPKVYAFGHSSDSFFALYRANVGWDGTYKFIVGLVGVVVSIACVFASFAPAVRSPVRRGNLVGAS